MKHFIHKPLAALLCMGLAANASVADAQTRPPDLASISLEDLLKIEITSASRKEQRADDVAAAVYVITHDDIRRSGIRTLPELFRLAPGVQVAQINANNWAVSVRGFNGMFSNKLLVLIDGRSIYNRAFSGVFWNSQDLLVDDIDRIEIIRGPGGAVWGANAVNGVVNIVTKSAAETQGGLVRIGAGTSDQAQGAARYGGSFGNINYRVYSQWSDHGRSVMDRDMPANDSWQSLANGFRLDWTAGANALMVTSDFITTDALPLWTQIDPSAIGLKPPPSGTSTSRDGTVSGRWTHKQSTGAELQVAGFVDLRQRITPAVDEREDVLDLDVQYHTAAGTRHDLVLGGGYRDGDVDTVGALSYTQVPKVIEGEILNLFAQDEISFGRSVKLTVGSKFARDNITRWGVQPTARVMWNLPKQQRVWAAVSRALRTPSAHDLGMLVHFVAIKRPTGPPLVLGTIGNPNYHAEEFKDVEAGYRLMIGSKASLDVSAFRGDYHHLQTNEPVEPVFETSPGIPHLFVATQLQNLLEADTGGVEIAGHWTPVSHWRFDGSYSALHVTPHLDPTSRDTKAAGFNGSAPHHQLQVQSTVSIGARAELNASLFHVSRLRAQQIPGYTRADARLEINLAKPLSLIVTGQNLFNRAHVEFPSAEVNVRTTLVPRRASAHLVWKF